MADRWRDEERYRRSSGGEYRGGQYGSDYGRSRGGRDYGRSSESESGYGRDYYGGGIGGGSEDYYRPGSFGYGREGASGAEYGQRGRSIYDRDEDEWGRGGWQGSRSYAGSGSTSYGRTGGDWSRRSSGAYGSREAGREEEDRGWWDRAGDEVRSWFGDDDAERRRRMDEYRGRGPKGYTRSDDRIREDVCDRLCDDPRVDASNIEVTVSNGEVTLAGTVDARDVKRRAEDCAEDVSGVKNVQNNLRVQMQSASLGSTTGASSMATGSIGATGTAGTGTSTGAGSTTTGARSKQTT